MNDHRLGYEDDAKKALYTTTDVEVVPAEEGLDQREVAVAAKDLTATQNDILFAEDKLSTMSLERCRKIIAELYVVQQNNMNFPHDTLTRMREFLDTEGINEKEHDSLVHEMKLEAILATENSPYAEVRATVPPTDDTSLPVLTFRVWIIGTIFSCIGAFINQLFSARQPGISVSGSVTQILAYPFGKFLARVLPRHTFNVFGMRFSMNPGPFNQKEHLLITIFCSQGLATPYTGNIILMQALPIYFNMPWAKNYGYQIISTIGSNFIGYGLAGLCRPFIVFPSYALWPGALPTLAVNRAFHQDDSSPIPGPFRKMWTWSRFKFFFILFTASFVYFWFPNYIFQALSQFNWMAWIAPDNVIYTSMVGTNKGLGLNPWPTFDWNWMNNDPLTQPLASTINQFAGMFGAMFMIIGIWFSNAWNTGHLPINDNHTWDNTGKLYKVTKIINQRGSFVEDKYQAYSEPWMAAGNLTIYFWFFAIYTATVTYACLYHRHDIAQGFRFLWKDVRRRFKKTEAEDTIETDELAQDIHYRLMQHYPEVPEWWYMIVLAVAFVFAIISVAVYPTYTSPAVVVFGIILAFIFTVPIGIIHSVTGIFVTLNVIAEFIGGAIVPGEAVSLTQFKMYGLNCSELAIVFCHDLKLGHYGKLPPRATFIAQIAGTLVSSFICTAVLNFQMSFEGICTAKATWRLTCPGANTFFTAAVFWGTLGPKRLFGPGKRYNGLLIGFPAGVVVPLVHYALRKKFPRSNVLRLAHPVALIYGGLSWAPFNLSYYWPGVMIACVTWLYIRPRYLAFWGKYNYVLSGAMYAGIALSAIIQFFALSIPGKSISWWGNDDYLPGCEAGYGCPRLKLPEKGYFGVDPGNYK